MTSKSEVEIVGLSLSGGASSENSYFNLKLKRSPPCVFSYLEVYAPIAVLVEDSKNLVHKNLSKNMLKKWPHV
jgi:hypothetical protein